MMGGFRRAALLLAVALTAACGDAADPTATTAPTTPTEAATTTTSMITEEQLAAAAAVGDYRRGEELFTTPFEGIPHGTVCASCHSLDGVDTVHGPTLAAISGVAGDRVDGMSAIDYLRQSIVDPFAYRVPGDWLFPMPVRYGDVLTEDQIDDLVAFLLTR